MKKTYSVNVHYDYYAPIQVVAESEDDAIAQAKDLADVMPMEKMEYCDFIDACITNVE